MQGERELRPNYECLKAGPTLSSFPVTATHNTSLVPRAETRKEEQTQDSTHRTARILCFIETVCCNMFRLFALSPASVGSVVLYS